jgi:hypothetical protein
VKQNKICNTEQGNAELREVRNKLPMEDNGSELDTISFNARFCQVMNEIYSTPLNSKGKTNQLLNQINKLNNKDLANSLFISVFQNIKTYIKEKRDELHKKLLTLGLSPYSTIGKFSSRRHSMNSLHDYSECFSVLGDASFLNENYRIEILVKYSKFAIALCEAYKEITLINEIGLETICQQILLLCQPGSEVSEYDIHKSLFYDYVLRDKQIMVRFNLIWNRQHYQAYSIMHTIKVH